jgi:hypothetical protein
VLEDPEHGARTERTVAVAALQKAQGARFTQLARDALTERAGHAGDELVESLQAVLKGRGFALPRA